MQDYKNAIWSVIFWSRKFSAPTVVDFIQLICTIIADEEEANGVDPMYMYYVNDGVYGSFSNVIYDHANPKASPLHVCINCFIACYC